MEYSIQERAKVAAWYEWTKSVTIVQRKFQSEYARKPPTRVSIYKWHTALMETGNVQNVSKKRMRSICIKENVQKVEHHFSEKPHSSLRRASAELMLSRATIHRILGDLHWHPYKIQILQTITKKDKANRVQYALAELKRMEDNENHIENLLFSDEAHFHTEGNVNRHNHRYWSPQNPHWFAEKSLHSPKLTVWVAFGESGIIGPFFFDKTISSASYLEMLKTKFYPALKTYGIQKNIIFMQDGAPPHWGKMVRDWLNQKFPNRWIGRGSPNMPWPPRSPDLTPCDFFLWGFVKSKVYNTEPADIESLRDKLIDSFNLITPEMRTKTLLEYRKRLLQIVENGGDHVEISN